MSSKPLFSLSFIVFFLYSLNSFAEFTEKKLLISNSDNELKKFTVEVADNDKLRSLGFMGKQTFLREQGCFLFGMTKLTEIFG